MLRAPRRDDPRSEAQIAEHYRVEREIAAMAQSPAPSSIGTRLFELTQTEFVP
jgi:hypothetical protein